MNGSWMDWARPALFLLALGTTCVGCANASAVTCGDGSVCPAGFTCDATSRLCVLPGQVVCGDGVVEAPEQCDDGQANSNSVIDACRTDCQPARCGDGVEDTGEDCDDRNTVGGDGCSAQCRFETCGNGFHDALAGEECDDGNAMSRDGCSSECLLEVPAWSPVSEAPTPPARRGARLRFSILGLDRWLAGGVGADGQPLLDLWRFSDGAWHQVHAPHEGAFRDFVTPVLWSATARVAGHPLCNKVGSQDGQWLVLTRGPSQSEDADALAPLHVWRWRGETSSWERLPDGPPVPAAPHDAVLDLDRNLLLVLFPTFTAAWDGTTWTIEPSDIGLVSPERIDATPTRCYSAPAPKRPAVAFATESFVGWYDQGTAQFVAPPTSVSQPGAAFMYEGAPSFLFRDADHSFVYQLAEDGVWSKTLLGKGATQERPAVADGFAASSNGRGMIHLFGGGAAGLLSEAYWVYDEVGWVEVVGRQQPRARSRAALTFDRRQRESVLFGGASPDTITVNTWTLGERWLPGEADPIAGLGKHLGFDATTDRLMLMGDGQAWVRSGRLWLPAEPPPGASTPAPDALVAGPQGSLASIRAPPGEPVWVERLDDLAWSAMAGAGAGAGADAPSGQVLAAATHRTAETLVVIIDADDQRATWTLTFDGQWTDLGPLPSGFPGPGGAMAYDPARDRIVHHGGTDAAGAPLAEVWEFDLNTWMRLDIPVPGPAMASHALIYDEERRNLVAVGPKVSGFTGWRLAWSGEGIVLEDCTNLVDDDGDGRTDCADPDCAQRAGCQAPVACTDGGDACVDQLWCTTGVCEEGSCSREIADGYCVIDETCVVAGDIQTGVPECWCAPDVNATDYTCHLACGDGEVQDHEQCDDGGQVSGDGCSATCDVEHLCLVTIGSGGSVETLEVAPDGTLRSLAQTPPTVPFIVSESFPRPQRFGASGRRVLVANGPNLAELHLDWDGTTSLVSEPATSMHATSVVASDPAAESFFVAGRALVGGLPASGVEMKLWVAGPDGNLFVPPAFLATYQPSETIEGLWLDRLVGDGVHDVFNGTFLGFPVTRLFAATTGQGVLGVQAIHVVGLPRGAMGTGPVLPASPVRSVRSGPSHRTLVTGAADSCLHGWTAFGSGPVWADTQMTWCDEGPDFVDAALAGADDAIWVSRTDGTVERGQLNATGLTLNESQAVGVAPGWLRLLFEETVLLVIGEDGGMVTLNPASLEVRDTLPATLQNHTRQSVAVVPCQGAP